MFVACFECMRCGSAYSWGGLAMASILPGFF